MRMVRKTKANGKHAAAVVPFEIDGELNLFQTTHVLTTAAKTPHACRSHQPPTGRASSPAATCPPKPVCADSKSQSTTASPPNPACPTAAAHPVEYYKARLGAAARLRTFESVVWARPVPCCRGTPSGVRYSRPLAAATRLHTFESVVWPRPVPCCRGTRSGEGHSRRLGPAARLQTFESVQPARAWARRPRRARTLVTRGR